MREVVLPSETRDLQAIDIGRENIFGPKGVNIIVINQNSAQPKSEERRTSGYQRQTESPPSKTGLTRKFTAGITLLVLLMSLVFCAFFYQEIRHSMGTVIGLVLVFLFIGSLLALYLSRIIVVPIQRLVRAIKSVAREHESWDESGLPPARRFRRPDDLELRVQTNDEIEQLADEFQVMIKQLENSYQSLETIIKDKSGIAQEKSKLAEYLKELNRQKEDIIKERTREVVEKNLKLYESSEELQFQKEGLIGMNEQLEKTSRMKSEFLASMSHELRTPMNSIIGFAEVLKDKMFGELNERQEKYISNILTSGRHLLQLINNILDITKVEAGKMKLMVEPYSINRVIDEVQSVIKTLAYKKNIELKSQLCQNVIMRGDVAKVKQILYNLLSNAIKFTDEKGVVAITLEEIPAGQAFDGGPGAEAFTVSGPSLCLQVRDTGIGIKPEEQTRIFEEFEQTEKTRRRRDEGTGLGLALTRKLVHLHGGQIWIQSAEDKGTTVSVVLPEKVSENEEDQEENPA